jgi:cyclopropane-fatty-acyl-phospholipid synthase
MPGSERALLRRMALLFTLKQGKTAYLVDFALYACATAFLLLLLLFVSPRDQWLQTCALIGAGLVAWTAIEYLLHRFILHGMEPFRSWHAAHHRRPQALIFTPTILSATLFAVLVFLPALLWGSVWQACALTLGVLAGYLAYAVTHHATHHWRASNAWLRGRKRWHARHHHETAAACYGVTSGFWDHVFASAAPARPPP